MPPSEKKPNAQLTLCVFPNQASFLVVDTREPGGQVSEFAVRDILSTETCSKIGNALGDMLNEDDMVFKDILKLPEKLEFLLQRASLRGLLDLMNVDASSARGVNAVAVMMFTGDILKIDDKRLRVVLKDIFGEHLPPTNMETLAQNLEERIHEEKSIEKMTSDNIMRKIISGDEDIPFRPMWKRTDD